MKKQTLIAELQKISKSLFNEKQYYKAGKINVAIDLLEEVLPQADVKKSVCDLYNKRNNCTAFRFRKEDACINCMHNKQTVL